MLNFKSFNASFFVFYIIFLVFFSSFFYADAEFFLAFSAFLIFFIALAIINSFFDNLIVDKFTAYKNTLSNISSFLDDLNLYSTSLLVYLEDICDFMFYLTTHDDQINEIYELTDVKILQNLDRIFLALLDKNLNLENLEYLIYQVNELEYIGVQFVESYANESVPKRLQGLIDEAFFEPRSLKQLYVARPVRPGDYIPDWQPDL